LPQRQGHFLPVESLTTSHVLYSTKAWYKKIKEGNESEVFTCENNNILNCIHTAGNQPRGAELTTISYLIIAKLCRNGWRFILSLISFLLNVVVVVVLQWIILHKNGLEQMLYIYVINTQFIPVFLIFKLFSSLFLAPFRKTQIRFLNIYKYYFHSMWR
jgi:hypothetical protein